MGNYLGELSLTDSVAIEDDALRLGGRSLSGGSVELEKEVVNHVLHLLDVLLLRRLDPNLTDVLSSARVNTGDDGRNGWLGGILLIRTGMSHVSSHDDHLLFQQHARTVKKDTVNQGKLKVA